MPTIAFDVLDWLDAHPEATSAQKNTLLKQVPSHQWAAPEGHWKELALHCQSRVQPALERRPANALCIEIGTPMPRCTQQAPDGYGLRWLLSGGSVLVYGRCLQSRCPNCKAECSDANP